MGVAAHNASDSSAPKRERFGVIATQRWFGKSLARKRGRQVQFIVQLSVDA